MGDGQQCLWEIGEHALHSRGYERKLHNNLVIFPFPMPGAARTLLY